MGENMYSILLLVGVVIIMYLVLIRPQKKKDTELKQMRNALKVGDKVITIGGIYGRVYKVKDDRVTIEIGADRVKLDFAKWGISQILNADGSAPSADKKGKAAKEETSEDITEASPKKLPKKIGKKVAETGEETIDDQRKIEEIEES